MKNMEREKFEASWKHAFEKAEIPPSENVWTNIELDLEKARGGELKKRVLFYKMLAAACVVFAMAAAGIGYYYSFTPDASGTLADNRVGNPSENHQAPANSPLPTDPSATSDAMASKENSVKEEHAPSASERNSRVEDRIAANEDKAFSERRRDKLAGEENDQLQHQLTDDTGNNGITTRGAKYETQVVTDLASNDDRLNTASITSVTDKDISALYSPGIVRLHFPSEEAPHVDPVVAMLAKLAQREREVQDDAEKRKSEAGGENLWTSIGFAAGSFNAMQSSSSAPAGASPGVANALTAPIVDQETKASGYSYTMGVNVGTKLSDRWVLQGGVNYLTHSSEYTANNVVMEPMGKFEQQRFRAASTNDLVNADEAELSNKLVYSAPYNVNNYMRYLSIPMQAGYLLVNKTFGLQVNAGVATDLFLQNTVKAESDQLESTSQSTGSDSPFRAVNLSGLFGTEFSYRFGPHYRVSLNPGLRYPFNTIYKTELGVQSTPLTFDVGLRFRYIFH